MFIEKYLSTPCEELTEGDYKILTQEYKYQRRKKITKIVTGVVASAAIGGFMLLAGLYGALTSIFTILPVGLCAIISGVVGGGLAYVLCIGRDAAELSNVNKLPKQQLKALKSKIKEYQKLHHNSKVTIANKPISYEEYKKQQGITSTPTNPIESNSQKYIAHSHNNDLHL